MPCLGAGGVAAGDAHVGAQHLLAQGLARHGGQGRRVIRVGLAQFFGEKLADLLAGVMDGRGDDVRGRFALELHDVFAKVRLHGLDAGGFKRVVEMDLLAEHGLALDHAADLKPFGHAQAVFHGIGAGLGQMDMPAPGPDVRSQGFKHHVQVVDHLAPHGLGGLTRTFPGRKLVVEIHGLASDLVTHHGQGPVQLLVLHGLGGQFPVFQRALVQHPSPPRPGFRRYDAR